MPFFTLYQDELKKMIDNAPVVNIDEYVTKPMIIKNPTFEPRFLNRESITDMFLKCEEDVLKNVLQQILKREPELEDAKRLTRGFIHGKNDGYLLSFDGFSIGEIKYTYPDYLTKNTGFKIEFIPSSK